MLTGYPMTTAVTRMSVVAKRIMSANAEGTIETAASPTLVGDTNRAGAERVVPLFAEGALPVNALAKPVDCEEDWAAAIDLVHSTAARVRVLNQRAQTVAREAEQRVSTTTVSAQAAEERARRAEAAMQAALARMALAEEQVRTLQEKIQAAEARAGAAEVKASEALAWLRRMHECVAGEFNTLTIPPSRA